MAEPAAESFVSKALTLVWLLLIATVVATYFIQRYKVTLLPPSTAAMVLGIACGGIVKLAGLEEGLKFSSSAFFYGLLPPIVFAAGFTLKKREFFRNVGTISLFAVAGTLVTSFVFGFFTYLLVAIGVVRRKHLGDSPFLDCMLFGALISATDSVAILAVFSELDAPPLLYNFVFGESVLNDAIAVVLFSTLSEFYSSSWGWTTVPLMVWRFTFISLGSLVVGIGVAMGCAFILKRFQLSSASDDVSGGIAFNGQIYEMTIIIMSAYLAYLVAEVFKLSGIVALFFTAICHAHYSFYSIEAETQISLRSFFEFAAFLSETFVFIYLGLQVAQLGSATLDWGLLITGLPLCVLARAANIFPLAQLANWGRKAPLPLNLQAMMVVCGLRGAIAYGLATRLRSIPGGTEGGVPAIESATLVIVVLSTILFGGAAGPLLSSMELKGATDIDVAAMGFMTQQPALSTSAALQLAREVEEETAENLYGSFKELDARVLKPLFGGRGSPGEALNEHEALLGDDEGGGGGLAPARSVLLEAADGFDGPSAGSYRPMHGPIGDEARRSQRPDGVGAQQPGKDDTGWAGS